MQLVNYIIVVEYDVKIAHWKLCIYMDKSDRQIHPPNQEKSLLRIWRLYTYNPDL